MQQHRKERKSERISDHNSPVPHIAQNSTEDTHAYYSHTTFAFSQTPLQYVVEYNNF